MTRRRITGNVWNHGGDPIPSAAQAELVFIPEKPQIVNGEMFTGTEVPAAVFNRLTGAFSARLDAAPGLRYRAAVRWLTDGSEPERTVLGYAQWEQWIYPWPNGGVVGGLVDIEMSTITVLVSLSPPPPGYRGWWLHSGPGDPDDESQSGTSLLMEVTRE